MMSIRTFRFMQVMFLLVILAGAVSVPACRLTETAAEAADAGKTDAGHRHRRSRRKRTEASGAGEAAADDPAGGIRMVRVTTEHLNVRTGPGTEYPIILQLTEGDRFPLDGEEGGWYRIRIHQTEAFISKDYAEPEWYRGEVAPADGMSRKRRQLMNYAGQFVGIPYKMGGESLEGGGIDCSSFVQQCLQNALGICLDRTSRELAERGFAISLSEARPGDLLFYADESGTIDHVAFYMGDGQILHASRTFGEVAVSDYNYKTEPVLVKNVLGD